MKRIMWFLSALGAVSLAVTTAQAQTQTSGTSVDSARPAGQQRLTFLGRQESGGTSANESGSAAEAAGQGDGILRYQRTRSSEAPASGGLKNYHSALFGSESGASPSGGASPSAGQPHAGQPHAGQPQQTRGGLSITGQVPGARPQTGTGSPYGGRVQQAGGTNGIAEARHSRSMVIPGYQPGGVNQAGYETQGRESAAVQQINHSEQAPSLTDALGGGPAASKATLLLPAGANGNARSAQPAVGGTQLPADAITDFSGQSPAVTVQWHKTSDINVGQPCDLELIVNNNGQSAAKSVVIEAWFPQTVRLTKAIPQPESTNGLLAWTLPSLDAGEERRIKVTMIPSVRGEITANANVRFTAAATSSFEVAEPLLEVAMSGASEVAIGEPASQVVTVSNPGTGVAQNVIIEVLIPAGLTHPKGERLKMDVGSLNPGEKRSVRLSLTAEAGGEQVVHVEARSGSDLRQVADAKVTVIAPSLTLAVDGPALRYVGRDARYTVQVRNDGQAVTSNVRAIYAVPAGFEFQSATHGGKYDEAKRVVSWFIGSMKPGETTELALKLKPVELGEFQHIAKVVSEHGASADATSITKIEGSAALVLEVSDRDDPVETARETAYEVRVRNEGSKEAQNVGVSFELPAGVTLVNVKGPSTHIAESGLVVFKALPVLPAGQSAVFEIHVKGSEEGNKRVRARLTSDSIQEPLTVEELTRFYAE